MVHATQMKTLAAALRTVMGLSLVNGPATPIGTVMVTAIVVVGPWMLTVRAQMTTNANTVTLAAPPLIVYPLSMTLRTGSVKVALLQSWLYVKVQKFLFGDFKLLVHHKLRLFLATQMLVKSSTNKLPD
jgi:hypothetical protein